MCLFCSRKWHGAIALGAGTCRRCVVAHDWQANRMTEEQTTTTGETRDGTGSGDHDVPFIFGNWRGHLTLRMQARCTLMRGLVRDVGRAPPDIRSRLRFGGDSEYIDLTPTGLYVASLCEPEDS